MRRLLESFWRGYGLSLLEASKKQLSRIRISEDSDFQQWILGRIVQQQLPGRDFANVRSLYSKQINSKLSYVSAVSSITFSEISLLLHLRTYHESNG